MFEKLKEKLVAVFKESLAGAIEDKKRGNKGRSTRQKRRAIIEAIVEPKKTPEKAGFIEKFKAAVLEQEIHHRREKPQGTSMGAEMALLKRCALPVAEKIVENVKTELVGTRRKIGSDYREYRRECLRHAISKVYSVDSFDLMLLLKAVQNL